MIRLVATDLDGTLLDDPKAAPPDFIEWVRKHPDICVVIASGRQYYNMRKLFSEIEDRLYFIAENGAIVFRQGRTVYKEPLQRQDVMACVGYLQAAQGMTPILCGERSAYMLHASRETEENAKLYYENLEFVDDLRLCADRDSVVKIAVFFERHDAHVFYPELCGLCERLDAALSGECWIDLANKKVNKGEALQAIQRDRQITREESMAFGDYLNDYELLRKCGMSFAMENAHPDLKKMADHIAPPNTEGGVMQILRSLEPVKPSGLLPTAGPEIRP